MEVKIEDKKTVAFKVIKVVWKKLQKPQKVWFEFEGLEKVGHLSRMG